MIKIYKGLWDLFCSVMFILIFALAIRLCSTGLDQPVVYESIQTGRCVQVESVSGEYSCKHLPPRPYKTERISHVR